MKYGLLAGAGLWVFLAGVWEHDWRLILAGLAVSAIWPLIDAHVESAAHERVLDELWDDGDDDDLARSA